MGDRPIIFSAPMVRALLDGRKTQTRRLLNPQPEAFQLPDGRECLVSLFHDTGTDYQRITLGSETTGVITLQKVRYVPGDRLYVREAWSHTGAGVWTIEQARMSGHSNGHPVYRATDETDAGTKFWPSIHMPREFSRLTLIVEGVKVERLGEISEEDARAEGITFGPADRYGDHPSKWILGRCRDCAHWDTNLAPNGGKRRTCPYHYGGEDPSPPYGDAGQGCSTSFLLSDGEDETARFQFLKFWDSLHGLGSGKTNPWVVALTFRVIHGNIDQVPS